MESKDDNRNDWKSNNSNNRHKRKRLKSTTLNVKNGEPLSPDRQRYELGWIFTDREQRRILSAMTDSIQFMRDYGRPPVQKYKINQTQNDE